MAVTTHLSLGLLGDFPQFMVSQGWDVHVASGPGERLDTMERRMTDVSFHVLPLRRKPSPVADIAALVRATALIRKVRPDVISAGTPKAGLIYTIAGVLGGVKIRVYHQRGLRLETATGIQRMVLWCTERLATMAATSVLCVSNSLRAVLRRYRLLGRNEGVVVGAGSSNGVDVKRFAEASQAGRTLRSELGEDFVVGFVGRITRDKGFDVLARALSLVPGKTGGRVCLLAVGDVEDDSLALVNALEDSSMVRVVVRPHAADVVPYFGAMDLLVLPTRREGFPNVVLEAAAAGVPTITTDATGAVDSVIDGVTGLVVPVNDSGALAEAIAELGLAPAERRRMGDAARARVATEFDRGRFWPQLHDYYASQVSH